ncbi:Heat shock protein 70 [Bacteroidales bacterium Barb4]|nr:Heat shock protein 70 [Bacteroidales bacterium Barb4]
MIKAHFKDIRKNILSELDRATEKIVVAVYWFTNEELFQKLMDKVSEKITVELIIHNDCINNRKTGLQFQEFIDAGGNFYFSDGINPMHNKFCAIDNKILITGSYNWTYYAENKNRENILLIEEEQDIIDAFTNEFDRLKLLVEKVDKIKYKDINSIKNPGSDFKLLEAEDFFINDIVYKAHETGRKEIVEEAFKVVPKNIEIQKKAYDLGLTKKWRLKHSIGASLNGDRYLKIIKKDDMIPISQKEQGKTVSDKQTSATSTIHYGENLKASENAQLTTMTVGGIPPKPAGEAGLEFYFSIDIYGVLRMEMKSLDNKNAVVREKPIIITEFLEEVEE